METKYFTLADGNDTYWQILMQVSLNWYSWSSRIGSADITWCSSRQLFLPLFGVFTMFVQQCHFLSKSESICYRYCQTYV